MYYNAILVTLAVSLIANIFLAGYMVRFKRKADFWHEKFHDAVSPVVPPPVTVDPYEGVKQALEYSWEGWD